MQFIAGMVVGLFTQLIILVVTDNRIVDRVEYLEYKTYQQKDKKCDTFSHSSITPSLCKYKGANND